MPIVYRFVCPDGRSYVGAVSDGRQRHKTFGRMNARISAAQVPPDGWRFEILERLRPGCSKAELHAAEQRHIDRLRSWLPENGYNIVPAVWAGDGRRRTQRPPLLEHKSVELDRVLSFAEWCALNGIDKRTGERILRNSNGPVVTQLSERKIGITVGNNRHWQEGAGALMNARDGKAA